MTQRGRHVQHQEHHPSIRWCYHTYNSLTEQPLKYGLNQSFVRTKAWLGRDEPESIFQREWDVLIVLDAARNDEAKRADLGDLDIVEHDQLKSVASCTWQWIPRTFFAASTPPLDEVAYISANPHTDGLSEEKFGLLDEPWKYAWNDELGTVEPRVVTDRAINVCRNNSYNRIIIHYIQPHTPYLTPEWQEMSVDPFGSERQDVWPRVIEDEIDVSKAIAGYRETLQKTLDEVGILLSNIDAETAVITADHGEAFGEYGIYGHPADMYINSLIDVPWIETTAIDSQTHTPTTHQTRSDTTVEQRLESLGYK